MERPIRSSALPIRRRSSLSAGLLALACLLLLPYGCQEWKSLPEGLSYAGEPQAVGDVEFIGDLTWVDSAGIQHVEQRIFDEILTIIGAARRFIVLDMFLYNPFLGEATEPTRRLSHELTEALVERKRQHPELEVIVITDPINTVYGGLASAQFERLRDAGIEVVTTRLVPLKDSNPVYSLFWRVLARPFGNGSGTLLPNPFGEGRVSLRSYLTLLNFKANHRKTLLADHGDGLVGLVTSANPHDGSSAHTNVAIRFDGPAVLDLLETENAVLDLSGRALFEPEGPFELETAESSVTVQILTEEKIRDVVIGAIAAAERGDALSLAMFYLADRDVIDALESANARGVETRVLLDPNKDAFGRQKQGIPNRPVAHELHSEDLPVRWCDTHGEQCHVKMLLVEYRSGTSTLIAGSANFTRRNLEDFNLETDVAVRGPSDGAAFNDARAFFDLLWRNTPERTFSTDYATFADESAAKRVLYRFMEASGISTF